jgi:hypothetical protein
MANGLDVERNDTHQTSVHGENLLIDDRSDGQTVEAVGKRLPELDVVPAFA